MQRLLSAGLLASVLFLTGCYHVQVETGLTPGNQVIDIPWAHSFIGGLVPPAVLEAQDECTSGVAMVESELSFLNLVANAVTAGLYSPMHITVTCASDGMSATGTDAETVTVAADADAETVRAAFQAASQRATASNQPIQVRFE